MMIDSSEGTVSIPIEAEAVRDLAILQRWYPRVRVEVEHLDGRKSVIPITQLDLKDGSTIEPNVMPLFSRLGKLKFA